MVDLLASYKIQYNTPLTSIFEDYYKVQYLYKMLILYVNTSSVEKYSIILYNFILYLTTKLNS